MSYIHPVAIGGNIFGYSTNYNETKNILSMCSHYGLNLIDTADVYSNNLYIEHLSRVLIKGMYFAQTLFDFCEKYFF